MAVDPDRRKIITPPNDWPEYRVHVLSSLARIEESQKAQAEKLSCLKSEIVGELRKELQEQYVSEKDYNPVKRIVFGFTGIVLVAFAGALIKLASLGNAFFPTGKP